MKETATIYTNRKQTLILQENAPIDNILDLIKKENYSLYVNAAREANGIDKEEEIIADMPCFNPSEGLVHVHKNAPALDEYILSIPSLFAAWESANGLGFSLLFRVQGNKEGQNKDVVKAIIKKYKIYGVDEKSPCIVPLSADSSLYHNPDAKPYSFKAKKKKETVYMPVTELQEQPKETPLFTDDKAYHIYSKPIQEIDIYYNTSRIPTGKQYSYLSQIAAKMIAKESEKGYTEEELFFYFAEWNRYCEEPLPGHAMKRIFTKKLNEYKKGTLSVGTKTRYGKVNPNLSRKEKSQASQAIGAEVKTMRTINAIEAAILQLNELGEKVTAAAVAQVAGRGESTVKKYYKEIKEKLAGKLENAA